MAATSGIFLSMTDPETFNQALSRRAGELGFDLCRIVSPDAAAAERAGLDDWLANGAHGTMKWMKETAARRRDPKTLWPEVRSIVMLAVNYGPDADPLASLTQKEQATISVYARNRDYHDVLKGKLKTLAQWMLSAQAQQMAGFDGAGHGVKVFVDTAPVMEKPLAAAAGIGWQGKHTNLVSREFGSWLFLGSIFTTMELPFDQASDNSCGTCRACLDICPTNAFPAPYHIDARRCISYLTIEHGGHIEQQFRQPMGNRIYGCDDCLAICPWNKFAQSAREAKLAARAELQSPALADLLRLDDAGFRSLFAGSPVKRIGHARFIRNVLIAAGNSGSAALLPFIKDRLTASQAIIRAMAVWAASQIASREEIETLAAEFLPAETDKDVQAEWQAALEG
jgi:epoxyqueuosine reductase